MKPQQVLAIILLVSLTFNAGLQVNPSKLASILRTYRIIVRAVVANFIVVPLGALLIVTVLRLDDLVATGMLLMAIAPGVPFVILAGGRAKGGSHDLAVALAVILPLLSFLTIPITAELILPTQVRAEIPESQLFGLLTFQIVPLLLGAVLASVAPGIAEKLTAPIGRLTIASLLALFAVLVPAIVRSLFSVIGTRGILAAIAIDVFSLAVGWVFGGRQPSERFTFSIGTALRNPGIAMLVATRLPETVVAASVTVYFLVQFLGATIFGGKAVRAFAEARSPGLRSNG